MRKTREQKETTQMHRTVPLLALLMSTAVLSCSHDDETASTGGNILQVSSDYVCMAVNMGNYSESNGSLTRLCTGEPAQQNLFARQNGYSLRSIVESAAFAGGKMLLMCGNADKVEIVDEKTCKAVAAPVTGIGLPRYAAVDGNTAYVSCVNPSWNDTVGFVTKIDIANATATGRIKVKGNPEGITLKDGKLYVAGGCGVSVVSTGNMAVEKYIPLPDPEGNATARYFVTDHNGDLWLSFTHYDINGRGRNCGVAHMADADTFDTFTLLPLMNGDAYIDTDPLHHTLYYMYSSDVVGGRAPESLTSIYAFDLNSHEIASAPLCTGHGFYGFNVDPGTGNIFTANVNGFITNTVISVFSPQGELLQGGLMAGVGTCRFYFRPK